jgi:hypothetical protein
MPILQAMKIPLMNIEIGNAHLIAPLLINQNNIKMLLKPDNYSTNATLVFQCFKMNITSKVKNPLNRNLQEYDAFFEEAKSSRFLYKPGFIFDELFLIDRQYSIFLNGISLFLSNSFDLIKKDAIKNLHLDAKECFMNPAAMWNSLKKIGSMEDINFEYEH